MKLKKLMFSLGVCSLLFSQVSLALTDVSGTYKNQRGSIMQLTWHVESGNTGTLSGTFTTAVGNCKEDMGVPLPLMGYFNGSALSVTVNFPHCKQVVAMTGNTDSHATNIHTIWLDATQSSDWNANIIGTDDFKKID